MSGLSYMGVLGGKSEKIEISDSRKLEYHLVKTRYLLYLNYKTVKAD